MKLVCQPLIHRGIHNKMDTVGHTTIFNRMNIC